MGVVNQRGYLVLAFRYRGRVCREYLGEKDTPELRREWERKFKLIKAQILNGTFDYAAWFPGSRRLRWFAKAGSGTAPQTVGEYLDSWLKLRSPFRADGTLAPDADLHPTTWLHDKGTIERHLKPALGAIPLAELKASDIRELRAALQQKLKGKTVGNIIGLLRSALEDAVRDGDLPANPVPRSKRRRRGANRPVSHLPFSPDEVWQILDALPARIELEDGTHVTGSTIHDLYTLWSLTGWRSSEITALRFSALDFAKEIASIIAGRSPRRGGLEARPKNDEREVHLAYAPILFEAFARRKREAMETGRREHVFTDSLGRPLNQEQLAKRVWNPTLRRLGLAHRGQYHLRHTAATNMLEAGERPGFVAHVLGTSEEMIWKHYKKWIPAMTPDAGHAFYERMTQRASSAKRSAELTHQPETSANPTGGGWRRGELNTRRRENPSRGS